MRGPARQPQPCHAHMSGISDGVAVARQHLVSRQPVGAATAPCQAPPRRRQARPMAAYIQHSWLAYGSASGCWSSHSCGQHTALFGRGRMVRSPRRTSQPGCWQQAETGCAATGSGWDQTSRCGQKDSATGSEGDSFSAGVPSPHEFPRRHPRSVASLEGWNSGQDRSMDRKGAGAPACSRRQACLCSFHSDVLTHTWCQACVEVCLLGRESSIPCQVASVSDCSRHGGATSLVIGCAVNQILSYGLLIWFPGC